MKFKSPLIRSTLIRRYKRFLADVTLPDGSQTTVHVPNSGSMMGLSDPGFAAYLSSSDNPRRKYKHTLELIGWPDGTLIGANTMHPNQLAVEAIEMGLVPELQPYEILRREVKYGKNSRIDILLETVGKPPTYVEVKNVHLFRETGLAEFPDCVTARGAKHLAEMSDMVANGARAAMLFVVQSDIADEFTLSRDLDPGYGKAFDAALSAGVEAYAVACRIDETGIFPDKRVKIRDLCGTS